MCKWDKCFQKDVCPRFIAIPEPNDQVYMKFKNKCYPKNDWYWFYGDRSKMVKAEMIEEKEEEKVEGDT